MKKNIKTRSIQICLCVCLTFALSCTNSTEPQNSGASESTPSDSGYTLQYTDEADGNGTVWESMNIDPKNISEIDNEASLGAMSIDGVNLEDIPEVTGNEEVVYDNGKRVIKKTIRLNGIYEKDTGFEADGDMEMELKFVEPE
jgi:hypothetical protein